MLQIETTSLAGGRRLRVTINTDRDTFNKRRAEAAKEISREIRIPGYRMGKAPYIAVQRHVGEARIVQRAAEGFLDENYHKILEEIDAEPEGPRSPATIRSSDPPIFEFVIEVRSRQKPQPEPVEVEVEDDVGGVLLESAPSLTERRLLARLREYFDNGYRDPEMLYLGGRQALSLGMNREARRFLKPLATMMCQREELPTGYAPVGLLLLLASDEVEEREVIRKRLLDLAEERPSLDEMRALLEAIPWEDVGEEEDDDRPEAQGTLAEEARDYYEANNLTAARTALESMLLENGDQPAVLRNLITVTSEQQDVEAYERYWRRYVKVLLWRIVRGEEINAAWQELLHFYTQVAEVTDRDLDGTQDVVRTLIAQPGFLPRWLEAHAGLVWLESALKSRRTLQTNLGKQHLERGFRGNLALMRYWFHLFYPEFERLLDLGSNGGAGLALPSGEIQLQIYFDPTLTLLKRFLEWQRFGFGLKTETVVDEESGRETKELVQDRHAENIVAVAGCVARIPTQHYTLALEEMVDEDRARAVEDKTLRQMLQEACAMPFFQFRLSNFLNDPPDWQGVIDFFGDPEMESRLSPPIRLFLALAFCQREQPLAGLRVAREAVPEIPADQFKEETQSYNLWQSVLSANIGHAIEAEAKPEVMPPSVQMPATASPTEFWIRLVKYEIGKMEGDERVEEIRDAAFELVDNVYMRQVLVKDAVERSKALVGEQKFEEALQVIADLPDEPDQLKELKENLTEQIQEARSGYEIQQKIEAAIERSKKYAEKGDFARARKAIKDLPDTPEEVRDLKGKLLGQIAEAEKQYRLQAQIEDVIERSKAHVQKGNFYQARQAIRALPDSPPQIKELKQNLLGQIDEAEGQHELQERIEEVIEESKAYVAKGNFRQARRTVNALPDSPPQVKELKQNLISQINQAEKQALDAATIRAQIDGVIQNCQRYVQNAEFSRARREIRGLPDSPAEVKQLKRKLLSQIDDAEREYDNLDSLINELLKKFVDRGVNLDIAKIARDNDVDLSDKRQFYGLLKAIDRQLF
ncbi:MAG: trigger factor [Anaerolineae bacterium]